jgi:hypothetical protein
MLNAILIGVGATAFMDITSMVRVHLGTPFPHYDLVGRWLAHVARGRLAHGAIVQAAPVNREGLIGWTAHYVIGVGYAALLLLAFPGWDAQPTLAPALVIGIATVLAPFLIMQPGMGMGLFASSTPNPNAVRLRSLITHALFGLGLYVAGLARLFLFP